MKKQISTVSFFLKKTLQKSKTFLKIIFIWYPLTAISYLTPRKKQLWLFNSAHGFFDNSKYLYLDIIENYPSINAIWITTTKAEAIRLQKSGHNAHYCNSIKGLYYLFTANIFISSYGLGKALPKWAQGTAKHVSLWHGIALKNMGYKGNPSQYHTPKNLFLKLTHKIIFFHSNQYTNSYPDLFLITSDVSGAQFQECFNLPTYILYEANYPRCNILTWNNTERLSFINKHEPIDTIGLIDSLKKYEEVFVYMPTWRDHNPDYLKDSKIDFTELNKIMIKKNSILLLKFHPRTTITSLKNKNYSNIELLSNHIDIYPILPYTTTLITDYSSVFFDYLHLKNNSIIFFPFDIDEYIEQSRDFAYDYSSIILGERANTFKDLISLLLSNKYKAINKKKRERIYKMFWGKKENKGNLIDAIHALDRK